MLMASLMSNRKSHGSLPMLFVTENLIGSQTQAASMFASSARSFPSFLPSRVADNVTIQKERPSWVQNCMSAGCLMQQLSRS